MLNYHVVHLKLILHVNYFLIKKIFLSLQEAAAHIASGG